MLAKYDDMSIKQTYDNPNINMNCTNSMNTYIDTKQNQLNIKLCI